jgi:phosphonate transport system ATP-binding protein
LADEPVASLDPATAERLLAQMHEICKTDGLTAIVSLHQLEFARQFADRIVGLAAGAVVFDGAPSTLGSDAVSRLYGATEARAPGDQTTQTFNLESAAA